MSEIQPKSKSPKSFFEIRKKGKKFTPKKHLVKSFKNTEDHIMQELLRLSYKNENGNNLSKVQSSKVLLKISVKSIKCSQLK